LIAVVLEGQNPWLSWLPLIGVLLGGLLTGRFACLTLWLQLRHQKQQERNKLYREKLQELHEVVSEIKNVYNRTTGAAALSLAGAQPFTNRAGPPLPIERLQMLVRFYAPRLESRLQKLLQSREQFAQLLIRRVGMEAQTRATIQGYLGDLHSVSSDLDRNAEEMQQAIVELSRNYI
jgi:hypothetical protein